MLRIFHRILFTNLDLSFARAGCVTQVAWVTVGFSVRSAYKGISQPTLSNAATVLAVPSALELDVEGADESRVTYPAAFFHGQHYYTIVNLVNFSQEPLFVANISSFSSH